MSQANANTTPTATPARKVSPAMELRRLPERPERPARETQIPTLTDGQLALAQKSVENIRKARQLALSATCRHDWTDVGGKPYLNSSGAMKVAALFGVSLTGTTVEQFRETMDKKEVVRYIARTTATFLCREVEVEGVASSDESFFAKKNDIALPLSEINLNAVRKKAVTNAQSRAVKTILGLGGITWEEVQEAGVKKSDVSSVEYAKQKNTTTRSSSNGVASRATRLKNILVDLEVYQEMPFEALLKEYSEFVGNDGRPRWATSIETMSDKWLKMTLERAEGDWRVFQENGAHQATTGGKEVRA